MFCLLKIGALNCPIKETLYLFARGSEMKTLYTRSKATSNWEDEDYFPAYDQEERRYS